jgi:hypothetical protein
LGGLVGVPPPVGARGVGRALGQPGRAPGKVDDRIGSRERFVQRRIVDMPKITDHLHVGQQARGATAREPEQRAAGAAEARAELDPDEAGRAGDDDRRLMEIAGRRHQKSLQPCLR